MNIHDIVADVSRNGRNFAADLDDTSIDFNPYYVKYIDKVLGLSLDADDISVYSLSRLKIFRDKGFTKKDICKVFRTLGRNDDFMKIPLMKGYMEFLHSHKLYDKTVIITARTEEYYDDVERKTKEYVDASGLPKEVVFEVDKLKYALENEIRLFAEDKAEMALELAQHDITVLLYPKPWNMKMPEDRKNLYPEDYDYKYNLLEEIRKYENKSIFRTRWDELRR